MALEKLPTLPIEKKIKIISLVRKKILHGKKGQKVKKILKLEENID